MSNPSSSILLSSHSLPAAVAMDSIFEETSSPSVMPVEVAEAEGLLTRPSHATTNKWGPILYNRDHHPLHIMVAISYTYMQYVYVMEAGPPKWNMMHDELGTFNALKLL